MWVRFGRWIELGVHFGRQNRSIEVLDGYTVHASLRFGQREWNYGPHRPIGPMKTPLGVPPAARIDLYPDPEPLRWGVRKVVSPADSIEDSRSRRTSPLV